MRRHFLAVLGSLALVVGLAMCGGTSPAQCDPGQSIACVGSGGCSGYQVCNAVGSFDSCICGGDDGGGPDGFTSDSGNDVAQPQESGTDGPTSTDGGSWTPANISGLSLWLNDDVGMVQDSQNAGHVKHWLDQSGNGNDAYVCTTGCSDPGYDQAAVHGHDAIACTGGYMELPDSTSLQFGTGDFAVAMVALIGNTQTNSPASYYWRNRAIGRS